MATAKEILENFYREETALVAAQAEGDPNANPAAMLQWMSPDVVVKQSADLPWAGDWVGHKGFADWAAQMSTKFSALQVQNPVIFETTGSSSGAAEEIISRSTLYLKVLGTGDEFRENMVQIITVNKEKRHIETIIPIYQNVGGLKDLLRKAGHIE